jgi:hypothetical protein
MRAGGMRRGGGQMHFEGENTISSQVSRKRLFISTEVQWCGTEEEITPTHANLRKVAQCIRNKTCKSECSTALFYVYDIGKSKR